MHTVLHLVFVFKMMWEKISERKCLQSEEKLHLKQFLLEQVSVLEEEVMFTHIIFIMVHIYLMAKGPLGP